MSALSEPGERGDGKRCTRLSLSPFSAHMPRRDFLEAGTGAAVGAGTRGAEVVGGEDVSDCWVTVVVCSPLPAAGAPEPSN